MPDTRDDDLLHKEVALGAAPERVFAALTDPELMRRWLSDVADVDARLGGDLELVFQNRNGTISVIGGEITEFAPPHRFAFRWHSPLWTFPPLHVTLLLHPTPEGTRLELLHSGFAGLPLEREIHDLGWDHYLDRLAALMKEGD